MNRIKRSVLFSILAILAGFWLMGLTNSVYAGGTFSCKYITGRNPACQPDTINAACTGGSTVDPNKCNLFPDKISCETGIYPCIGGGSGSGVQTVPCADPSFLNGQCLPTALGQIPVAPESFVVWILKNAVGMGGGIAFLLILWGGFQILISSGNPEKVNEGKEIITSAVAGLLMIVFSVILLKIIGYDILGIPGFFTP